MTDDVAGLFPAPAADATLLGDLVGRSRRTDAPALRALPLDRGYSYRDLSVTAAKAGNFLRHLGIRGAAEVEDPRDPGRTVEVAPDPRPEPVATLFGAAGLGAAARLDPVADGTARVTVVGSDRLPVIGSPPGAKLVVYGDAPDDPAVEHWESSVWSENPYPQPARVEPEDDALVAAGRYGHTVVLAAARAVRSELGLAPGDAVAVRDELSDPRVVVAGVVAPLLAGGTVVFPDGSRAPVGVASVGDGPEPASVDPGDVPL